MGVFSNTPIYTLKKVILGLFCLFGLNCLKYIWTSHLECFFTILLTITYSTGCLKISVPVCFMNSQKITQQAKLAKKWNIYGLNYYLFIKNENWGFEQKFTILDGTPNFMSVEFCLKSMGLAYIEVEFVFVIRFVWSKMRFKADFTAKILLFTELNYL